MNLICGINPVLEALDAGSRHFDRLLVVKGIRNQRVSEAIARASQLAIPLRFEPRDTLDRMAGGIPHQGLIAVVSAKPVVTLEDLLDGARTPALLVVLDGVEDPRNLGAILRTADAAGADGVLLPDRHSAGLSETVARASAGGIEHVRVARIGNVSQALEALKAKGIWVVGFDASGTERWDAVDYTKPIALVLGGEGRGMRRLVRERCDHLVSLPLFGHVGSLNVSVAAGIALYEVVRQRRATPSHVRPIPVRTSAASSHIVGPAPDDPEHDAGRSPGAHAGTWDDEDDDGAPSGFPLAHDVEDQPAWNTGPEVIKAAASRHLRGGPPQRNRPPRRGERGRDGARREGRRDAPARGPAPEAPVAGDAATANDGATPGERPPPRPGPPRPHGGKPGRRRRGRGPGGRPGGDRAPGEPGGRGPREGRLPGDVAPGTAEPVRPPQPPGEGTGNGSAEAPSGPGGAARRRRRRRRR